MPGSIWGLLVGEDENISFVFLWGIPEVPEGIMMVIYFHDAQLVNACELRLDAGRLAGQRANRTAGTGVCLTGKIHSVRMPQDCQLRQITFF